LKSALLLLCVIAASGTFAFWSAGTLAPLIKKQQQENAAPKADVRIRAVRGVGYVEPVSGIRKLSFKADGIINSMRVQVGQVVKAGDELAALQNRDELAAINVAKQDVELAKADREKLLSGVHPAEVRAAELRIARLAERQRFNEQLFARESKLFAQKVGTKEKLEEVTSDLHQSQTELKEAQAELNRLQNFVRAEDRAQSAARVALAEAKLSAARDVYNDTILVAPVSGTVLEILKREGEAVRAFDPTPVLVFADLSKIWVRCEIDERYVNDVRVGQPASLFGRGMGNERVDGRVVLAKELMGKKTVFTRASNERKDLETLEVFVEATRRLKLPVGLKLDVEFPLDSGQVSNDGKSKTAN
jgi:multidrug resistance efflux pump